MRRRITLRPTPAQAASWSDAARRFGKRPLPEFLVTCVDLSVRYLSELERHRRTPDVDLLARHDEAKEMIGALILAAMAACPYVPDSVAAPGGGSLPIGLNLSRAVENVQAFLAVTGEEY